MKPNPEEITDPYPVQSPEDYFRTKIAVSSAGVQNNEKLALAAEASGDEIQAAKYRAEEARYRKNLEQAQRELAKLRSDSKET